MVRTSSAERFTPALPPRACLLYYPFQRAALLVRRVFELAQDALDHQPQFDPHALTHRPVTATLYRKFRARNSIVNTIGNLTLITSTLNSSVSHGNFSVKMPALRTFTSLALNRELQEFELWDEPTIRRRGAALFELARTIWAAPKRAQPLVRGVDEDFLLISGRNVLPPNGSRCRFTYAGNEYTATVVDGAIVITDVEGRHGSFSAASKAVSGTIRNGWNDWYIQEQGRGWILANDWRKESRAGQLSVDTSLSTELGNAD